MRARLRCYVAIFIQYHNIKRRKQTVINSVKVTSFTFNLWNHLTHEHFAHNERRTVTFRTYQSNISEFSILTRAEWPYSVRAFQSTLCTVSVSKLVKPYLFYCIMDGAKLVSGALKHVWLLFYMWISDFDNVYLICITLIYRGATVLELSTLGDVLYFPVVLY